MEVGRPRGSWLTWDVVEAVSSVAITTASLLVYGVLQERVMTIGFGVEKEVFSFSIFLVLCNRLCTCLCTFLLIAFSGLDPEPSAPLHSYAAVSVSNVIATSCQYEALKFVSFALQTLAKSSKVLPVMMWGSIVYGKRYKLSQYGEAVLIATGSTIFVVTGSVQSRTAAEMASMAALAYGSLLMLVNLLADGLTSTWQDRLFVTYNMGTYEQVLYTTAASTVLSLFASVATGQLLPAVAFTLRHPQSLWWLLGLSLNSFVIQIMISFTIKKYGALVLATVMTTRQFFSILLSSIIFLQPLSLGQWLGLLMVMGALYRKTYDSTQVRVPRLSDGAMEHGGTSPSTRGPRISFSQTVRKSPQLQTDSG